MFKTTGYINLETVQKESTQNHEKRPPPSAKYPLCLNPLPILMDIS